MPIYNSVHDLEVARLARYFNGKDYATVIDVTNKKLRHIPDLLLVSRKKRQILWIEVESKRNSRKKNKLHHVDAALKQVGGRIRIFRMQD